jgi:hypothetical protein
VSYPTFNGWTIIDPPPSPGFSGIVLRMIDTVGKVRSPFSAQSQVQLWPGADWWEFEYEMPPLSLAQAADWQGWLASLQGGANVFQVGDSNRPQPQNPVTGSIPVCATGALPSAVNLAGATSLATSGWRPSQSRVLLRGDYLQVGYRLHIVLQAVSSDVNGDATINVWPSLREQPVQGQAVILNCPKGLFWLASNARQLSISVTRLSAVGFKCVEAR